jgi:cell division protein FtsN
MWSSSKAETTPKETQQYRYIYRLQVGSYRSKEAAYSVKDKLLAIGEKPEVKKVGNWYRVDIKPVYSKRKGDMLKHKIQDAGISGSVLRQIKKIPVKKDKK